MQGIPHFSFFLLPLEGDEYLLTLKLFPLWCLRTDIKHDPIKDQLNKKRKGTKTREEEEEREKEREGLSFACCFVVVC